MKWFVPACVTFVLLALYTRAEAPRVALSQATNEVVVEKDVRIPMRDGVKLAADVYRPAQNGAAMPGKFATLLSRTPYNKTGAAQEATWFAARGYVVVLNDVRGRYASEGTWTWMVDDVNDGFDVVTWIGKQEWCSGKVGTFGTSYVGGTQHALAL